MILEGKSINNFFCKKNMDEVLISESEVDMSHFAKIKKKWEEEGIE